MLSFMRDEGPQPLKEDGLPVAEAKDNKRADKSTEQGYITVATKEKQVRKGTYLLVVLFCTGMLCLLFMIRKSSPKAADATGKQTDEPRIESVITQLIGVKKELFGHIDEIVNKFYEFSDIPQIKVSELVKNPFKIEQFLGDLKTAPKNQQESSDIDIGLLWQQQLLQQSRQLQLLSIMQAENGYCCMIDDKILYEGESIRGFKITQITDSYVKLEAENTAGAPDDEGDATLLTSEVILKLSE